MLMIQDATWVIEVESDLLIAVFSREWMDWELKNFPDAASLRYCNVCCFNGKGELIWRIAPQERLDGLLERFRLDFKRGVLTASTFQGNRFELSLDSGALTWISWEK